MFLKNCFPAIAVFAGAMTASMLYPAAARAVDYTGTVAFTGTVSFAAAIPGIERPISS